MLRVFFVKVFSIWSGSLGRVFLDFWVGDSEGWEIGIMIIMLQVHCWVVPFEVNYLELWSPSLKETCKPFPLYLPAFTFPSCKCVCMCVWMSSLNICSFTWFLRFIPGFSPGGLGRPFPVIISDFACLSALELGDRICCRKSLQLSSPLPYPHPLISPTLACG